ncbi:hypothetical protein Nmel_006396 [Mimus melanotis]
MVCLVGVIDLLHDVLHLGLAGGGAGPQPIVPPPPPPASAGGRSRHAAAAGAAGDGGREGTRGRARGHAHHS